MDIVSRAAVALPPFLAAAIVIPQAFALGIGDFNKPQPGLYPLLICVILMVALVPVAVRDYVCDVEPLTRDSGRVFVGAALVVMFIVLWPILGLPVSSAVALFLWIWLLRGERIVPAALASVITGLVCAYVFGNLLGVPLPRGILGIP
jgi:hypothetical protein